MSEQPLIFAAMIKVMKAVEKIEKSGKMKQSGRDIPIRGVYEAYEYLQPIFKEHSIFQSVESCEEIARWHGETKSGTTTTSCVVKVRYRFYTIDGSFVESEAIGCAMDTSDKAYSKAMSTAHKYALFQTFVIPDRSIADNEKEHIENAGKNSDAYQQGLRDGMRRASLLDHLREESKELAGPCKEFFNSHLNVIVHKETKIDFQKINNYSNEDLIKVLNFYETLRKEISDASVARDEKDAKESSQPDLQQPQASQPTEQTRAEPNLPSIDEISNPPQADEPEEFPIDGP